MLEASVWQTQLHVMNWNLHELTAEVLVIVVTTAAGRNSLQLILIYLTKYSHYRIDIIEYYYINIF